jgi:hypothetical protein
LAGAASVRLKLGPYEGSNSKAAGSPAGLVTLSTRIWPRFVFVNVQVTVSPAARLIAPTGLPSEQVAPVRSQPAGMLTSATE